MKKTTTNIILNIKYNQVLYLLIAVLFTNCKPIKFKEHFRIDNQNLKVNGKVRSVTHTIIFENKEKDTVRKKYLYNGNKYPQELIKYYSDGQLTSYYTYEKGKIISDSCHVETVSFVYKWKYDANGNNIERKSTRNGKVVYTKKNKFDNRNNKIERLSLEYGKLKDKIVFSNDYKKRVVSSFNTKVNRINKTHYDKKGNIIFNDYRFGDLYFKYDRMGEMIYKKVINKHRGHTSEHKYIITYDNKNNIIQKKTFVNSKLTETINLSIDYL